MALGDPFNQTYEGAYKAGSSLGEGIQSAASSYVENQKLKNSQKRAMATLKMLEGTGLQKKEEPLSTDEFNKQAENIIRTNADKMGASDLQITGSDNPEERRKQYQAILDPLGLTPKPKVTNVLDTNSMANKFDISVDSDGKMSYKLKEVDPMDALVKAENYKYLKNINSQMDNQNNNGEPLVYRKASTGEEVSADIAKQEIAKGNKDYIVNRKVVSKSGVKEEPLVGTEEKKFMDKQNEDKKSQDEKSQFVLDSANDTLNTIKEVEKGIDNFGLTGNVPSISGTNRKNWEVNINKLLSGKIIDVMTKMKEASKTGSTGFGQLSNKELGVLTNASTSLKKDLSPKDAQRYLNDMKSAVQKIVDNKQERIQKSMNSPTSEDIKSAKAKGFTHYNTDTGEWLK